MLEHYFAKGYAKVRETGYCSRTESGAAEKMARDYIDSMSIEMRLIDSIMASTQTSFFGHVFSSPVMVAALSGLDRLYPEGMVATATGACAANVVMTAGIGDEQELKAIIATGAQTIKIIKPYKDKNLVFEKIAQAEKCGAIAVGMDIDFIFGGKLKESVIRADIMGPQSREDIKSYVHATRLPFIVKGVLSAQDARHALEAGAAAIVVSNHGARVLDYAVPPFKVLPSIAQVVSGQIPIFIDGAICRGTDVFKALALGASGAMLGTSLLPALAEAGTAGVTKMLQIVNKELHRVMCLTGCATVDEITMDMIWV